MRDSGEALLGRMLQHEQGTRALLAPQGGRADSLSEVRVGADQWVGQEA